jgi:uncharacterized protein (DUF2267 family)
MSASGLEVFDKTLQTTHIWLNEISDEIGPDKHLAWHVLGVVLRTLRDRLPVDHAAHLGAELPLLVRGAYYDQYRPATQPAVTRSQDEFLQRVAAGLADVRPVDPALAVRAVFGALSRHIPAGQIAKTSQALPEQIRRLWPDGRGDRADGAQPQQQGARP